MFHLKHVVTVLIKAAEIVKINLLKKETQPHAICLLCHSSGEGG